jgi:hypothetical protein
MFGSLLAAQRGGNDPDIDLLKITPLQSAGVNFNQESQAGLSAWLSLFQAGFAFIWVRRLSELWGHAGATALSRRPQRADTAARLQIPVCKSALTRRKSKLLPGS